MFAGCPLSADPPGVPARRAALRLLDAVLRRGLALEAVLSVAAKGLAEADRGLAHAIAGSVLRWLPDLDALIDSATRLRLADDAKARMTLRIALAQALVLGTPGHAAIATVLPLVEGGPRRLVHGVFGTLMRSPAMLPAVPTLPAALAERWRAAWGQAVVDAAARAIAAPPPIDLTLRAPDSPHPAGAMLHPAHVRLARDAGAIPALRGFAEGGWWVQDLAASLPARLIGPGPGTAIDVCAAPGGKTMQLAAAGWAVTAIDVSASRLARLADNLARTGLTAQVVMEDVLRWRPPAPADAVLLDAPCSATGIYRRHPEVLYRATPALIAELAEAQTALLARAADWVRPGGRLVYATCSLEPAEGEAQIERFLAARADYRLEPVTAEEIPAGIPPGPMLRLLPNILTEQGGCDGFFMARLRRD